jgi:hypothetical protein
MERIKAVNHEQQWFRDKLPSAEAFEQWWFNEAGPKCQRLSGYDFAHIVWDASADEARNCPRKTIQSAATNNIGGFLDSLVDLISEDAGQDEWIKAGELLEARDAAIRADEARKQAERYAACVEAAREYQKDHCKYCSDIPRCEECSINKIRKALADLEAPK